MIDCSRAQHQVSQTLDGKWFEYFILDGKVYENEIKDRESYTRTPASEVLADWGVCTQSNSNIPQQSATETTQPTSQLEANLMQLRAEYDAKQAQSSGMGGDGIGWIIILAAGVWGMQHATRFVDARAAKQVDTDLAQEYERIRASTPAPALAGAPAQMAETHEVTTGDRTSVTIGDRVPVTDQVTIGDQGPEEDQAGPVYCVNGLTLAEFKKEHCQEGGGLRVEKLHDAEYAEIATSKVFYFLKTFGFAPLEFCVWYTFGLTKKSGDSPYAQRYQVAANFCERIFDRWRLPY